MNPKGALPKWIYFIAGLIAIVSVFLPWWNLHATGGSVITNQGVKPLASFDLGVGPTGVNVAVQLTGQAVPIADPTGVLSVVSLLIAIIVFPVSASIVLAFVNGVYCPIRNRKGERLLIAPVWIVIALIWWFTYFLALNSAFGGGLQPTGTTNIVLGKYTLGTVTWGWGSGLWVATISIVFFFAASAISNWATIPQAARTIRTLGFHSVGLFVIAILNALADVLLILLATIFGGFTTSLLVLVPSSCFSGWHFLLEGKCLPSHCKRGDHVLSEAIHLLSSSEQSNCFTASIMASCGNR